MWLADPEAAARLIRAHEAQHEAQLGAYRAHEANLHAHHAAQLRDPRSPWFATWATLKRGLGYEAEYVAWCRWLAESLESATSR